MRSHCHAPVVLRYAVRDWRLGPVFCPAWSRGREGRPADPGKQFYADADRLGHIDHIFPSDKRISSELVRGERGDVPLCGLLYDDLHCGDGLCAALHGNELFHHSAGLPAPGDDDDADRRSHQHCAGSGVHLPFSYGHCRRRRGDGDRPDSVLCLCPLYAEEEEDEDPACAHAPGEAAWDTDRQDWFLSLPDPRD